MRGAARHLGAQGLLVTYGPYLEQGVPTAEGNLAFDASLRAQDSRWGIRAVEDVAREARAAGLQLAQRHALPANNLLLVWQRAQ
jgi:2-hydroxychromene-2-carboxylate isomerase